MKREMFSRLSHAFQNTESLEDAISKHLRFKKKKKSTVLGLTLDSLDPLPYKSSIPTSNFHKRKKKLRRWVMRKSFWEPDTHVCFLSTSMSQET